MIKSHIIIFVLFFFLSFSSHASSVWKITHGDNQLYLGGTIHVLAKSDYPLPSAYDLAYKKSSHLVFETDIAAMSSPSLLLKMNQIMTYNDGRKLSGVIKPESYHLLMKYFHERQMPTDAYQYYTPVGITLLISMFELQRMGLNPKFGVDQHFYHKAQRNKIQTSGLETPEEHLHYIADMGVGNEDEMIVKTLEEIKLIPEIMKELKEAWRTGDNKIFTSLLIEDMKNQYPSIYQSLLVERNNNWLPKIEKMLKTQATEFILVGALHLVGEDGLIKLLREKGYKIEQIK